MAPTDLLFPSSLISSTVTSTFPPGFSVRPLSRGDHARGFLDVLRVLTPKVGDYDEAEFQERYDEMMRCPETYYVLVIVHQEGEGEDQGEEKVVGTGILIAEKKFIHNRGTVGHIEEISIAREHQKKGLGLRMIQALDSVGVAIGAYKNVLSCGAKNVEFYEKCGYHNSNGIEMVHHFDR